MKCSVERLIEALIGVELARERRHRERQKEIERQARYVVTISRGYGSLGREVGQALADRLNVRLCDRSILEAVAERSATDVELIEKLDETVRHTGIRPWKQLFSSETPAQRLFHEHLVTVIMNIANHGGVILGRGAHLVLGPAHAFRVRVVGSLDMCAARVAERDGLDPEAAVRRVRAVDGERAGFLRQHFGPDSLDPSMHDLLLNSDRFTRDQMVELVLRAMQLAGYEIGAQMLQPS